jgi:hypothetical protein
MDSRGYLFDVSDQITVWTKRHTQIISWQPIWRDKCEAVSVFAWWGHLDVALDVCRPTARSLPSLSLWSPVFRIGRGGHVSVRCLTCSLCVGQVVPFVLSSFSRLCADEGCRTWNCQFGPLLAKPCYFFWTISRKERCTELQYATGGWLICLWGASSAKGHTA